MRRTVHLGLPAVAQLGALQRSTPGAAWMLLAHRVSEAIGRRLREIGVDYVDLAGNCHLEPGEGIYVHVEGRRYVAEAPAADGRSNPRGGGLHVLFVLAARPELASAPVREIARAAGAGKSTTAAMLKRLEEEGTLGIAGGQRRVLRVGHLRDRWLSSYAQTLRRRWIQGRFRVATEGIADLERDVATALEGSTWAWGGTAAEMRLLQYYRGSETLVHVAQRVTELPKRLRALPDKQGSLVVMVTPIPLAFEGPVAHVAHPLLVYSELLAMADDRAFQAAEELRERHPELGP